MQILGFAERQGVTLSTRSLADSAAGQVALLAGAVDVILSDLIWVSQQRSRGKPLLFVPFSLTVGGLMVGRSASITTLGDLKGQTIGIGGGPLDKNFIFLRACYQRQTGRALLPDIVPQYGAPALIDQLLLRNELGAALNFWQWNARALLAGARPLITVAEMLAQMDIASPPPLLGWSFTEATAAANAKTLAAFLDASFDTKQMLLSDDAIWDRLKLQMGTGGDDALFAALRDGYRAGIVTRYDPADTGAAQAAYAVLAEYGGHDVVGEAPALDTRIFWKGYHR
jgi:NitT/TauT family transport system substrate-binding protein